MELRVLQLTVPKGQESVIAGNHGSKQQDDVARRAHVLSYKHESEQELE